MPLVLRLLLIGHSLEVTDAVHALFILFIYMFILFIYIMHLCEHR